MHNTQHRSKSQTQRLLLKCPPFMPRFPQTVILRMRGPLLVPFISPYSRHGVWDVGSGSCWLLGCQAHLCLSSASTVHSVGQRTCWDSPTLFPLLPWPLGLASPSPRVGKEQASLPSCRRASTGSCSKSLADSTTPHSLFFSSNYFCNIFSRIFTRPRPKAKVFS